MFVPIIIKRFFPSFYIVLLKATMLFTNSARSAGGIDWSLSGHRIFQLVLFLVALVGLGYVLYHFVRNATNQTSQPTEAPTETPSPSPSFIPSVDELRKTVSGEAPLRGGTLFVLVFLAIFLSGFFALLVASGVHLYERASFDQGTKDADDLESASGSGPGFGFGRSRPRHPSILNGRVCIGRDGNCLFRSIAQIDVGDQSKYREVKAEMLEKLGEIMAQRPEERQWGPQMKEYLDVIPKEDAEEELEELRRVLRRDGAWGNHLHLRLASDLYGRPLRMLGIVLHKGKARLKEEGTHVPGAFHVFADGGHFEVDLEVAMHGMGLTEKQKNQLRRQYIKISGGEGDEDEDEEATEVAGLEESGPGDSRT